MQNGLASLFGNGKEVVEILVVANGRNLLAIFIYGRTATKIVGVLVALIDAPMREVVIQKRLSALVLTAGAQQQREAE